MRTFLYLTFLPLLNSNPGRAGVDSNKGEGREDSTPTPHLCGLRLFPPQGLTGEGEDMTSDQFWRIAILWTGISN